jgi:hypothetical protein
MPKTMCFVSAFTELICGGGFPARELRLGGLAVARNGGDMVAAKGPHVGHFLQEQ